MFKLTYVAVWAMLFAMKMDDFYIYTLTNPINGKLFYVGKGRHYRAQRSSRASAACRNPIKQDIVAEISSAGLKPIIQKIAEGLTEKAAYAAEEKLIRQYGRIGIDPGGILANRSTGGIGIAAGVAVSEERRKQMSEFRRGKTWSAETRAKMSESAKGRKHTAEMKALIGKRTSEGKIASNRAKRKQLEAQVSP